MSVTLADMEVTMRMRLPAIELAVILLPLPPECQHYRHKLPHLVRVGALEGAEQACLRSNGEMGVEFTCKQSDSGVTVMGDSEDSGQR